MMNQQQWPQLPLFLHTLEEKGFVLLAERYEFVLQIAQSSPHLGDLKLRLGALLSSSPPQQQQFAEWFEQFFNPTHFTTTTNAEQERQKEEWLRMQGALDRQIERTVQESPAGKSNRSFYPSRTFFILLMLGLVLFVCFYYAGFGLIAFVSIIGALVTFALIEDRKPERPFTLRREAIAPPSSFFDIHIPAYAEVRFGRAFQGIARRLRQRLSTDQPVLDVSATIRKSITQGGFFTPQYLYRSKAPAYLLLIDQSSVANHRFQLAELLYNWLHKQDIEVERFWYRNDPRTCWNEAYPSGIPLEQLTQRYAESQLLLFGDGWQLLNPASQKLQPWARAFAQWENRILVTPIAPPAWTRKETQLAQLFILTPASVEGLRYWSESMLPQTEQNSPKAPAWQEKAVLITKENFLTALRQHFPNERLREWLCALACFPVLNWELTLRIGAVLSQKYGTYLLDYANLRRLTRISWFYNGYIPEEMCELLYQQLDPTVAKLIHQCIVQILAEQVEDGRQHFNLSQRELVLQIAVQQVAAGAVQGKDLIGKIHHSELTKNSHDFLVLRHFNTPHDPSVPEQLALLLRNTRQRFDSWWGIPNPQQVTPELLEQQPATEGAKPSNKVSLPPIDNTKLYTIFPTMIPITGGAFYLKVWRYPPSSDNVLTNLVFLFGLLARSKRRVNVDTFTISKTTITFNMYDAFCTATKRNLPSDDGWGRGNRPVINVSWYDAVEFCNWLSQQHGLIPVYLIDKTQKDQLNRGTPTDKKWIVKANWLANGYRLPTRAEWLYAARGGQQSKGYRYSGSNNLNAVGWYAHNSDSQTHNVAEKKPNELGLQDLSGNVWEWCWDWFPEVDEDATSQDNPCGAASGYFRITLGGSWLNHDSYCRITNTYALNGHAPNESGTDIGFRVVSRRPFNL